MQRPLPTRPRRARAVDVLPIIRQAQAAGAVSLRQIAAALTARGIPNASGAGAWHAGSVRRVLAYAGAAPASSVASVRPKNDAAQHLGL